MHTPFAWPKLVLPRTLEWDRATYWALDLETSGLAPDTDQILSVGMVPVRGGTVHWGERFYSMVRPHDAAALSSHGIPAHHILPGELDGAPAVREVLPEIATRLAEGVLLLHFSALDLAFLKRAFRRERLAWPRLRVVDTVQLLVRLHHRDHRFNPFPPRADTGLASARRRLGLPPHTVHHALADALATAELFLVLRWRLGARRVSQLL